MDARRAPLPQQSLRSILNEFEASLKSVPLPPLTNGDQESEIAGFADSLRDRLLAIERTVDAENRIYKRRAVAKVLLSVAAELERTDSTELPDDCLTKSVISEERLMLPAPAASEKEPRLKRSDAVVPISKLRPTKKSKRRPAQPPAESTTEDPPDETMMSKDEEKLSNAASQEEDDDDADDDLPLLRHPALNDFSPKGGQSKRSSGATTAAGSGTTPTAGKKRQSAGDSAFARRAKKLISGTDEEFQECAGLIDKIRRTARWNAYSWMVNCRRPELEAVGLRGNKIMACCGREWEDLQKDLRVLKPWLESILDFVTNHEPPADQKGKELTAYKELIARELPSPFNGHLTKHAAAFSHAN